ncbi:hypothetical protein GCM10023238_37830 [Streptomyces heliomycini]
MGVEIDLTREQFGPQEHVVGGVVIPRPPEIRRLREEYELLRERVLDRLGRGGRRPRGRVPRAGVNPVGR